MTRWLEPVRAALDACERPVACFVRDDDGGWADDRLIAMLDVFERHAVPIDVAVIPDALTPALAARLAARSTGGAGGVLHLHQHGRAHTNHEPPDRRACEFGAARSIHELRADVSAGFERLQSLLADAFEPVFTPPWNRCVDALGGILADVGHRVLSRDHTAGTVGHPRVAEVPVNVDWFGSTKGERWTREQLGERIALRIAGGGPLGLMLHHGVTDDDELADVESVVSLLAGHAAVAPTSILAHAGRSTDL